MKRIPKIVILLCLFLISQAPVWAGVVKINDVVILRLYDGAETVAVQERLEREFERKSSLDSLEAISRDGEVFIVWDGLDIVEVTDRIAEANHSDKMDLANLWIKKIKKAYKNGDDDKSSLKLSSNRVEIPVDGSERVKVTTNSKEPVTFSGGGVVAAVKTLNGTSDFMVEAISVGTAVIKVQQGSTKTEIVVKVKDWAGYYPESLDVEVFGRPASQEAIWNSAVAEMERHLVLNPGANPVFPDITKKLMVLNPSEQGTFQLPIKIFGGQKYYNAFGHVQVNVRCLDIEKKEPNILLVSNRPERVDEDGVLLEYTISEKEPARLMYSHMNDSRYHRAIWVDVVNQAQEPIKLMVSHSFAGPSTDEVRAGHMAAVRFLQQRSKKSGFLVKLDAGERLNLAKHYAGPQSLTSGFMEYQLLSPGSVSIEVATHSSQRQKSTDDMERIGGPFNPFKIHPHGVFAQPFFEEFIDLTKDFSEVELSYGHSPWLIDFQTGQPNTGNFGAMYRFVIVGDGTKEVAGNYELWFDTTSGPAATSVLVEDKVYDTKFVKKSIKQKVCDISFSLDEEKEVEIYVLPEASSYYPATLILKKAE